MNTPLNFGSRHFGTLAIAVIVAAGIAAPSPATAGENTVKTLSEMSGVSERHVRMVLGNRTPYADYRINYDRKKKQLEDAIGAENLQRLAAGESVKLDARQGSPAATAIAQVDAQRERQP